MGNDGVPSSVNMPPEAVVPSGAEAMARLVIAVQDLSLARDVATVMSIVRRAAREITGADGATFVLREADQCFYADEDAIGPLFKGQRFPMSACISGWSMLHREAAVIEDIYADPRVPIDAYEPTFVRSLVMVPIRRSSPIGAIGNYWSRPYRAVPEQVDALQALADSTSVALENVQLYQSLEQKVAERAAALEAANEELRAAREQTEKSSQAKTDFLGKMSHELRTPLNSILGFAQLLQMDDLRRNQQESISFILSAGRHLLTLIDEVLDISRIEAGRLSLSVEPVSLPEVVRESLELMQPLAAGRQVALGVDEHSPGRLHVVADRQRLKQVLLNLLSNAVKYNRRGGEVTVSWSGGRERIRLEVRDTGLGIPPEMISRLFQPFERLGAPDDIEGTGLGLALSQRLASAMGASLAARSQVGEGSTFTLELARADQPGLLLEDIALEERQGEPASEPGGQATVLYVEDNVSNVRLVERVLARRPGVELLVAGRGSLALELAAHHKPDIILLDLHLPDMTGEEVLERLRADPQMSATPIVVVSADALPGRAERLMAAGAAGYLTKPLDIGQFLDVVEEMLGAP